MARLTPTERAGLPDSAFAYVDSKGQRRLPIHDQSHVRNALARFDQVAYETDASREKARNRLLRAAKKHRIMPVGFIENQLRSERAASAVNAPPVLTGTVTLLFTDIEGSTRLLRQLGDRYESVLDQVRHIVHACVDDSGGIEVEVRADETFSMFEDPAAAITAAIEMQRTLAQSSWPEGTVVRVRAGLHSGAVRHTSNGYIGLAIHKAARVSALAHGGQIICSAEIKRAISTAPDGIGFVSLGRHELAGLAKTHALYQLTADGLTSEF